MKPFITQTLMIPTNGIRLHVEAAGPDDAPLVILLHGFPEYWAGWDNQIGGLARSGLRVVVPDQRGYNLSDKPQGIEAYQIEHLAQDIIGLIDYFGREKATIVGHDWGAAVAWHLAIHHPQRVERLAILNVPHPAAMARALSRPVWAQLRRSWYIAFFQIPRLPEFLLSLAHYTPMRQMLRASAKPTTFSKEEIRRYTQAWAVPGALTSMLNWYRALMRNMVTGQRSSYLRDAKLRVTVPTLILWGEQDIALIPELAQWSLEFCDDGALVRYPEATHWVQHDEADRVTNRLLDFMEAVRKKSLADIVGEVNQ